MSKTLTSLVLLLTIVFGTRIASASVIITQVQPSLPTVTTFTSQSSFQSQLAGFTLWNLDAAPFNGFPNGYRLDDAAPAAALTAIGLDSIGLNAQVIAGQAGQISNPARDRLIAHGTGNGGLIAFNFLSPVNGVGAFSNEIDGGRILAFTGANLTGIALPAAPFADGGFGGVISTELIRSVQFTCDFNNDFRCGVLDVQFGTTPASGGAVPEPGTWLLLLTGAAMLAARRTLGLR